MKRVEVYAIKDGKVALGVYADDVEVACPLIPFDEEGNLEDWTDGELNCAVAEERGMTAEDISAIIEKNAEKIAEEVRLSGVLTSGLIESQLTDKFGKGTQCSITTHDGMEPETGLMYGDDECIDLEGRLYQYFHPTDSDMVYRCFYTIPEGETDWSNIDYSDPEEVEVSDEWGYTN